MPNILDTLAFDWGRPQGIFIGQVSCGWVVGYGFPEQLRVLTCIQLDPLPGGYAVAWALRRAVVAALNPLGLPCRPVRQHFRAAIQSARHRPSGAAVRRLPCARREPRNGVRVLKGWAG